MSRMSETVDIRDLKSNASRIVELAEAGVPITITRQGKPVARIISASMPARLSGLIADGSVRPGNGSHRLPNPVKPSGGGKTATQYVAEGRR
jgi:prevent-host-death family protein